MIGCNPKMGTGLVPGSHPENPTDLILTTGPRFFFGKHFALFGLVPKTNRSPRTRTPNFCLQKLLLGHHNPAHCKPGEIRNEKAGGNPAPYDFQDGFKIELGPPIFFGETYAIL